MNECLICKRQFQNSNRMSYHFSAIHKIKLKDFLLENELSKLMGIWPTCQAFNCTELVPWCRSYDERIYYLATFCQGHHHKGKEFSEQVRNKVSIGMKKFCQLNPEFVAEKLKLLNSHIAEEIIEKRNEAIRKAYADDDGTIRQKISANTKEALAKPEIKEKLVRALATRANQTPNNLEKRGYEILEKMEVEYIPQHVPAGINHAFDAFLPKYNLLLEFDGDYWHGNKEIFSRLTKEQKKQWMIDKKYTKKAEKCGFNVVRIWENNIETLFEALKKYFIT